MMRRGSPVLPVYDNVMKLSIRALILEGFEKGFLNLIALPVYERGKIFFILHYLFPSFFFFIFTPL